MAQEFVARRHGGMSEKHHGSQALGGENHMGDAPAMSQITGGFHFVMVEVSSYHRRIPSLIKFSRSSFIL
jgi:hypothetical protein